MYSIIQNYKACENLLLYIFKHDISRKSAVQLLLFFVVKRIKNCGLMSKHSNSIVIVFIVWRQSFVVVFARQILMLSPFFFWAFWLKKKYFGKEDLPKVNIMWYFGTLSRGIHNPHRPLINRKIIYNDTSKNINKSCIGLFVTTFFEWNHWKIFFNFLENYFKTVGR